MSNMFVSIHFSATAQGSSEIFTVHEGTQRKKHSPITACANTNDDFFLKIFIAEINISRENDFWFIVAAYD